VKTSRLNIKILLISFIVFCSVSLVFQPQIARGQEDKSEQEFHLIDGSVITGDIFSYIDRDFRVKTRHGMLTIPEEEVLYIVFKKPFIGNFDEPAVILANGERIPGMLIRYSPLREEFIIRLKYGTMKISDKRDLSAIVLAPSTAVAMESMNLREALPLLDKMQKIVVNPSSTFDIDVWIDKGEGKVYNPGDKLAIFFRSDRDCYLTLFDFVPGDEVKVIFPNKYHPNNFIEGGRVYKIPEPYYGFEFIVEEPLGLDIIKAIATISPIRLTEEDIYAMDSFQETGFAILETEAEDFTSELVILLESIPTTNWAEATTFFYISSSE